MPDLPTYIALCMLPVMTGEGRVPHLQLCTGGVTWMQTGGITSPGARTLRSSRTKMAVALTDGDGLLVERIKVVFSASVSFCTS